MFGKGRHFTVLLVVGAVILTIVIFSVPVIPVQYTVTQTRTRTLHYTAQHYNQSNPRSFVNVTNTDSVGGIFSVTLSLAGGKPVPHGVEFGTIESTTLSLFIDAGATGKFDSPEEWIILESMYAFFYTVTAPTIHENYNVTKTEYHSVISMISNQ